jgi:hypothetical protein
MIFCPLKTTKSVLINCLNGLVKYGHSGILGI